MGIKEKAAPNIPVCVFSGYMYSFVFGVYLGIRWLGHRISVALIDIANFPNGFFQFKFLPQSKIIPDPCNHFVLWFSKF